MKENTFTVEFEKGMLKDYEKEILISEKINFLIPMGFVEGAEGERVIYDYGDLEPISTMEGPFGVKCVLDILEKVVLAMVLTEDYLLDCGKIALSSSTIYMNRESGRLKLMYFPGKDGERSAYGNLREFTEELTSKYVSGAACEYLALFADFLSRRVSLVSLIDRIGAMKREAFICGIR